MLSFLFVCNVQMAVMGQERFKGSVTCPWCVALKEKTPGFFSEDTVAQLMSPEYLDTYRQVIFSLLFCSSQLCSRKSKFVTHTKPQLLLPWLAHLSHQLYAGRSEEIHLPVMNATAQEKGAQM